MSISVVCYFLLLLFLILNTRLEQPLLVVASAAVF